MPPEYDYDHITQLDAVELLTSRSSRIDFDAGEGLRLIVEAHSPGVFRVRCGMAAVLNDEKPNTRARALAEMLLARDEAVGEATIGPLDNAQGWQITQGDIVLRIESSPLRFSLLRGDAVLLRSDVSVHAPAFGHHQIDDSAEAV